jgi:Ca2+-binding RTX toxin-like protein
MANFTYENSDFDEEYEGLDTNDTISFLDNINPYGIGFLRDGDDLIIHVIPSNITVITYTVTLTNHFTSDASRIETLSFDNGHTIDLTASNIIYDTNTVGFDTYYGDNNDNTFFSSSVGGGDTFYGYDGNDIVYAGGRADHIYIGNGDDTVYAGKGTTVYNDGDGDDLVIGFKDGAGVTIDYSLHNQAVNVNLSTDSGDDDNDGITDDTLQFVDHVTGSDFDDILRGDSGRNIIYGGAGNDIIYGDDAYDGVDFFDRLYDGAGDDIVYGGDGADGFYSGSGTNQLYGEDGDDFFNLLEGNNIVDGGNGTDILMFTQSSGSVRVDLLNQELDIDNNGVAEGSVINVENVKGSQFDDIFKGNDQYNVIEGEKGEDILYASAGSDILHGGQGTDTYIFENIADFANDQYNTLQGFRGADIIDISDILEDTDAFDPVLLGGGLGGGVFAPPPITNYLRVTDDGQDTLLEIDIDGDANGSDFTAVALMEGHTGHGDGVQDMIDNGYLVIQ